MKTVREVIALRFWGQEIPTDVDVLADSILSALKEAGWLCVPVEATNEMVNAGGEAVQDRCDLTMMAAIQAWNAMIAASQDQGRE